MTTIPLRQGVEPPSHSLVDQTSTNGISDCLTSKNDVKLVEIDAMVDFMNVQPITFVTGPQAWPAHLQLKVRVRPLLIA